MTDLFCLSPGYIQYLKDEDEDLVSPPNNNGNQWLKFLQESTHLKGEQMFTHKLPQ